MESRGRCFVAIKPEGETNFKIVSYCPNFIGGMVKAANGELNFSKEDLNPSLVEIEVLDKRDSFELNEILLLEIFGPETKAILFNPEVNSITERAKNRQKFFTLDLLKMGKGKEISVNFKSSNEIEIAK